MCHANLEICLGEEVSKLFGRVAITRGENGKQGDNLDQSAWVFMRMQLTMVQIIMPKLEIMLVGKLISSTIVKILEGHILFLTLLKRKKHKKILKLLRTH